MLSSSSSWMKNNRRLKLNMNLRWKKISFGRSKAGRNDWKRWNIYFCSLGREGCVSSFSFLCFCDVSVTSPPKTPSSGWVSECHMTRCMTTFVSSSFVFSGQWRRSEKLEVCFWVVVLGWLVDTKTPLLEIWSPPPSSISVLKSVVCGEQQMPNVCGLFLLSKASFYCQSFNIDYKTFRSNLGKTKVILNLSLPQNPPCAMGMVPATLKVVVQVKWENTHKGPSTVSST